MANLNEWAKSVAGRYIDVDGWAGAQCWDLSQAWLTACNGGVLWTQPSSFPGLAAGSWEVAMQNGQDLLQHVTAIPGTDRGLPGDLIIWAYGSADYPISHTAVLIEDRGPILHTLSQNSSPARPDLPGYSVESSGPTIYQDLTRAGLLGFLRPRANITGQTSDITPITEDWFEAMSNSEKQEILDAARKVNRYLDMKTSDVPNRTWGYKNNSLERDDAYALLRAIRDRVLVNPETAKAVQEIQGRVTKYLNSQTAEGLALDREQVGLLNDLLAVVGTEAPEVAK